MVELAVRLFPSLKVTSIVLEFQNVQEKLVAIAEATGLKAADGSWGLAINEGRDIVNGRKYYEAVGSSSAIDYIYDATNFRLRELSIGYNWRNLLGEGKNLNVSVIARNLFFIYKKAPVDPDISLSTANGLGGFEIFNLPSARSFGVNIKLNF